MNAQTPPQRSATVRQTLVRYRRAITLGLLIVVGALMAYRFIGVPAAARPAVRRAQASLVEPAQQSVMRYLRAHESVGRPPASWKRAVQTLLDELRSYGW